MEIILNDKNGVVLHTNKKYCKEDISVKIDTQELYIEPTTEEQTFNGLYDEVIVGPTLDTSDATATAGDITKDKTAYVNGEKITGTLEASDNNAVMSGELTGGDTSYYYPNIYKRIVKIPADMKISSTTTNASCMFCDCYVLEYVPPLDMSNITNANRMFYNCTKLPKIELHNTNSLKNMALFAQYCSNLEEIIIGGTAKVTNFSSAFSGCKKLVTIPYMSWASVTTASNAFTNCPLLSDESLNTILSMCKSAGLFTASNKTLKHIGLTSEQATRCQSLSNYQVFLDAGWTTGY